MQQSGVHTATGDTLAITTPMKIPTTKPTHSYDPPTAMLSTPTATQPHPCSPHPQLRSRTHALHTHSYAAALMLSTPYCRIPSVQVAATYWQHRPWIRQSVRHPWTRRRRRQFELYSSASIGSTLEFQGQLPNWKPNGPVAIPTAQRSGMHPSSAAMLF